MEARTNSLFPDDERGEPNARQSQAKRAAREANTDQDEHRKRHAPIELHIVVVDVLPESKKEVVG